MKIRDILGGQLRSIGLRSRLSASRTLSNGIGRRVFGRPNRGLHDRFVRELFPCAKRISVGDRVDRARHSGLSCRMPEWRS
jgi:hypothetical protein